MEFGTTRGKGIRLADVQARAVVGLLRADDRPLQGFGMKVTYRIEVRNSFPQCTKDRRANLTRCIVARVRVLQQAETCPAGNSREAKCEPRKGCHTCRGGDEGIYQCNSLSQSSTRR